MPSMTSAWLSGTSSKISAKKHMANYQWLDVNGPGGTSSTHGLEQAMDRPERFPHPLLHICQQDDIDILVGVVTNHRARAIVDALFLCEEDLPGPINSELYPISVHVLPVIQRAIERLEVSLSFFNLYLRSPVLNASPQDTRRRAAPFCF